jgi:uncharacterized membrane-anchored protein YjiN (DUF445 family)
LEKVAQKFHLWERWSQTKVAQKIEKVLHHFLKSVKIKKVIPKVLHHFLKSGKNKKLFSTFLM